MKLKNVWLSRDADYEKWYSLFHERPIRDGWWFYGDHPIKKFCPNVFERLTGIRLKPGECRQVESITIKLMPKRKPAKRKKKKGGGA